MLFNVPYNLKSSSIPRLSRDLLAEGAWGVLQAKVGAQEGPAKQGEAGQSDAREETTSILLSAWPW